jgi:nucleoside 2-deoxyribosyltransferase
LLGIKIGETESKDLNFVAAALEEQKLLNVEYGSGTSGGRKIPLSASLTLAGWQKYEELQRSVKNSRKAFMAMEFPSSAKTTANYFFQNTLLDEYLIPAVKKTGYDLTNALRTEPMAGNIHARLEVEIRTARFVVAELSHHNNGAYWEAGFARGLGKTVIYMYNKGVGNSDRPHFDVGSDHYVAWEENQPDKAADDLKAVIRATLFGEAAMED